MMALILLRKLFANLKLYLWRENETPSVVRQRIKTNHVHMAEIRGITEPMYNLCATGKRIANNPQCRSGQQSGDNHPCTVAKQSNNNPCAFGIRMMNQSCTVDKVGVTNHHHPCLVRKEVISNHQRGADGEIISIHPWDYIRELTMVV